MTHEQRKLFADKISDMGNLATAGLVFGQFVASEHINGLTVTLGVSITIWCYFEAYLLSK